MPVDPQNDRAVRVALARGRIDDGERAAAAKALLAILAHELCTPLALVLAPLEEALGDEDDPLSAGQRDRIALAHRSGQRLVRAASALLELSKSEPRPDSAELARAVVEAFRAPVERTGVSVAPPRAEHCGGETLCAREERPPARAGLDAGATPRGARARVLVTDDDEALRAYVAQLLAPSYEVEVASDGCAALEAARARPPDLVLTDVTMPGMDGFALLAALHAEPATRLVPVVFLSALADDEARLAALEAGADDFLAKPFVARELLARVDAHLASARARRRVLEETSSALAEARAARAVAEDRLAKAEARLREARWMPPVGTPVEVMATILVVEDEDLARRLARRVLENAGFRVLEAANGREALDLVAKEPRIHLVLSDLVMPELTGRDLGKHLRDRGFASPVLYMTGYDCEHVARHALLDSGAPLLQKPFAPECLVREVRALLERSLLVPGSCTKNPMIPFE